MTVSRRAWLKLTAMAAGAVGAGVETSSSAVAASRGPTPPATSIVDHPGSGHDYRPALEALRHYVDLHLAGYGVPGMTLSVTDADGFSAVISAGWSDVEGRGPVTPDQIFQIGSISKSFCSLGVLRLVDAGKVGLDDPVAPLLPGLALPDGLRITVRHLLTHSSGLPADAPLFPRGGTEQLWQGFEPGSQFSYSNTGYGILGVLTEQLTGQVYRDALFQHVLQPLGLGEILPSIRNADRARYAASYAPYYGDRPFARLGRLDVAPWINMSEASGCMAATSRQMAAYVRWLIGAGSSKSAPLLSETSRHLFTSPAIPAAEFGPKAQYAFGLAIVPVDDRPCLHHTGGMVSFSSAITVDPAAGVGAFASVNARAEDDYRPREVTAYAIRLMRAVRESRPLPAAPTVSSATKLDNAQALVGRYSCGDKAIELATSGDGLALIQDGVKRSLLPSGEGVFTAVGPGDETSGVLIKQRGDGAAASVGWGENLYTPGGAATPPTSPELARLAGVYDGGSPWTGVTQVVARAGELWMGGVEPLVPLGDGAFRIGLETWGPERVRFDGDLAGRPQRLNVSGADFVRI